eukprot:scaffold1181_cov112-Isochrysis_galbana.AAC.4
MVVAWLKGHKHKNFILNVNAPAFPVPQRPHRGARPLAIACAEGCRTVMSALWTDRALKRRLDLFGMPAGERGALAMATLCPTFACPCRTGMATLSPKHLPGSFGRSGRRRRRPESSEFRRQGHAASYAVPQRRVQPREGSLGRTSQPSLLSRVERGLRSRWLRRGVAPNDEGGVLRSKSMAR